MAPRVVTCWRRDAAAAMLVVGSGGRRPGAGPAGAERRR